MKVKKFPVGAIHTYNELYARYYIDLTPRVALIAAAQADRMGNLFLAANTEDTPAIVEPTAFSDGIVFAQVNEIVDNCRASTSRPTKSILWSRHPTRCTCRRCSRAIPRRSPTCRC